MNKQNKTKVLTFNHIEFTNTNTLVKRAKSTALVKKCNPNRGPTKYRKGSFPQKRTEKGLSGTVKDFLSMISRFTYDF